MDKVERFEKGEYILKMFDENPFLLEKGYRLTKTSDRNIERPIKQFREFYEKTGTRAFSRKTIEDEILLNRSKVKRAGADPIQTGIHTMQNFMFLSKEDDTYILTYQFFDWINSQASFYDYFIEQVINIRSLSEYKGIYNGLLCAFSEWIKNGVILDFSPLRDEEFIEKVKPKKKRVEYCKFVKETYGFQGNIYKNSKLKLGDYCPDILQRIRTVFLKCNLLSADGMNADGIKQYQLTDKAIALLETLNDNIRIIMTGVGEDDFHDTRYASETPNDAPKAKKEVDDNKGIGKRKRPEVASKAIKDKAKIQAQYECELELKLDYSKKTKLFIERSSQKNYVEGHNLIPLAYAERFTYSLDVEANVICLCPRCHRLLHHGLDEERFELIEELFNSRKERLEKCRLDKFSDGAPVTLESILELY